jgi:hypothetical protein
MPRWLPPPPFTERDPVSFLPRRVYTRSELIDYIADTRRKAEATVDALTDERIARPVPAGHRYAGQPYAGLLLMCLTHPREHLAQLEMFLGQHGVPRT